MSDTILGGDFTVYYEAENRQKRILWTGSATGTRTVNELYSALQDLFDELVQLDDGTPMSAQTPTEYTIGIIDTGDDDPWFIDRVTVEHLYGGALKTASWDRVQDSNTGIVRVTCNNTSIVSGDIGLDITHADGDAGTLLDVKGTGAGSILWIRPDSSAAANNWDSTSGTITCNAHTATQSAAALSGESLWANIFTLGTIESNTHMYIEQNGALLSKYKPTSTEDWWGDGQIDILVNIKEVDVEVDEGYIKVFARQHSKTYAYFSVDLTTGGRNPIPLQTGDDLDNTVGYRELLTDAATGTWNSSDVGSVFQVQGGAGAKAILTSISGTTPNFTIQYYLIGDPIASDFANNDVLEDTGATKTLTVNGAPTDVNAADNTDPLYDDITVTHGSNETYDVDENDTTENYSIVVDCNNNLLQNVQERLKYITRRGETSTTSTDGQAGQFYIGSDYRLIYNTLTGTIAEGAIVTQLVTLATGTVVAHDTTGGEKILILRNSRGTFNTSNDVRVDGSNYVTMTGGTATPITPNAASPFGTFAGGKFFGAAGVVLINVPSADATNYQLTDDYGNVVVPPNKVTVAVANTRLSDKVAVFRVSGGNINKTEYSATVQSAAAATVVVGSAIAADVPGKTAGGVLRVVDVSTENEYRLRFSSWTGSTFTLTNSTGTATGGSQTSLVDSGASFDTGSEVKVGDLIYNTTESTYAYVVSIDSATTLTMTNTGSESPVTNWSGDGYSINALPVATTTSDYVYIPLIDSYETTGTDGSSGTEETTITFVSNISVRVVARNAIDTASTTTPMLPYTADATVVSTGLTNNIIRTLDTIKT
jgi:hypothetical protein